jgi:hypothetical protein
MVALIISVAAPTWLQVLVAANTVVYCCRRPRPLVRLRGAFTVVPRDPAIRTVKP